MPIADYFPFLPPAPARFRTEAGEPVYGMTGEYTTAADAYHAAEHFRDDGYTRWDVYSPFPIHGIEDAMGHKRTHLPKLVAAGGFTGAALAFWFQWWVGFDYPIVVQGKPLSSWEPYVMITFEFGILCAAFTSLLSMLALNGLPRWHHPLFRKDRFLKCSDDRFMICVEAADAKFDPGRTRALFEKTGASHVSLVEDE